MQVQLIKATTEDAESIFTMQVQTFMPLLEKYRDYETSPANETIDRAISRMNHPAGGFYKIIFEDVLVGAICVVSKSNNSYWIGPMFIMPDYQGLGIAQKAILLVEEMFPQALNWELATILEEKHNFYLYEKMGYSRTGVVKELNERTTLVYYKKVVL